VQTIPGTVKKPTKDKEEAKPGNGKRICASSGQADQMKESSAVTVLVPMPQGGDPQTYQTRVGQRAPKLTVGNTPLGAESWDVPLRRYSSNTCSAEEAGLAL